MNPDRITAEIAELRAKLSECHDRLQTVERVSAELREGLEAARQHGEQTRALIARLERQFPNVDVRSCIRDRIRRGERRPPKVDNAW